MALQVEVKWSSLPQPGVVPQEGLFNIRCSGLKGVRHAYACSGKAAKLPVIGTLTINENTLPKMGISLISPRILRTTGAVIVISSFTVKCMLICT